MRTDPFRWAFSPLKLGRASATLSTSWLLQALSAFSPLKPGGASATGPASTARNAGTTFSPLKLGRTSATAPEEQHLRSHQVFQSPPAGIHLCSLPHLGGTFVFP